MNLSLIKKYIEPRIWDGWLRVDGGWGPKNDILNIIANNSYAGLKPTGSGFGIFIEPDLNLGEANQESNYRYRVAFPGMKWKELVDAITLISSFPCEKQVWVLDAMKLDSDGKLVKDILQLEIHINSGEPATVTVNTGRWVPSFENALVSSRWALHAE